MCYYSWKLLLFTLPLLHWVAFHWSNQASARQCNASNWFGQLLASGQPFHSETLRHLMCHAWRPACAGMRALTASNSTVRSRINVRLPISCCWGNCENLHLNGPIFYLRLSKPAVPLVHDYVTRLLWAACQLWPAGNAPIACIGSCEHICFEQQYCPKTAHATSCQLFSCL